MPTGAAGCAWPTFARSSASPPATARWRSPIPTACVVSAGRPQAHVSEEALLAHLLKERAPEAARLRVWVEREIVFPARRERERLGIRLPAVDADASD